MKSPQVVREAAGAGRWFPGSDETLRGTVNAYIDGAQPPAVEGRVVGAIAPHAGYQYSGKVAGHTFRAVRDNAAANGAPETAVVLGFSHRGGFRGVAVLDGDAFETPMGQVPLDQDAGRRLVASSDRIVFNHGPHGGEHSAENQIPFVQAALPEAALVVALIGDHDAATLDALVDALTALAAEKRILVIASTDLLHHANYALVTKTDKSTLATIASLDADALAGAWSYGKQVCCGIGPVLATMRFARAQGCDKGVVLHYRNSGDDFPESRGSWVVGYGAVAFAAPE